MAGDCGSTCPGEGGFYSYDPSVGGNAVLLAAYAVLALAAFFMGFRFGTPVFSVTLSTGLLLEFLGFVGRLLLHSTPDSQSDFTISLLGTILGPTFMSGAIFLILPHILRVYGDHLCPFRPMYAALVFYSLTTVVLAIEVVGIVFVAYEFSEITRTEGLKIIAGGLGLQTVLLLCSSGLHFWFTIGLNSRRGSLDPRHSSVYASTHFKRFLMGMELATVLLVAYSIYRIAESVNGVTGNLFQSQISFMIINGALPLIACILLTTLHPGAAFGTAWGLTSPRRFKRRNPPQPLHPTGYNTHHRYDPFTRSQITPTSQKNLRNSSAPSEFPSRSPGLLANPRPSISPRTATQAAAKLSPTIDKRSSGPPDRKSNVPRNLVDSDELW